MAAGGRPLAGILLVCALSLGLSLFHTRSLPLIDRDEGRYAEAAREMLSAGDWLVPRLFGVAYLEKPPLFYWLTAAACRTFGVDELGARLVSAVSGAAAVLAAGLFARRTLGDRAGVIASLVLATSGLHLVLARVAITDALFSALLGGALMAYFIAEAEHRSFLPFWLLAAAATLTKGPVAAVLCGLTILGHLAVLGDWRTLRSGRFWLGLPLYLALAGSWLALLEARFPGFLYFYVYKEHLLRAAGDEHRQAFYWYVPWVLAGFLPWTPMLAAAAPAIAERLRQATPAGVAVRFAVVWAATVLLFFSVPRGKLVPYILPMFPALAIVLGDALARWTSGQARLGSMPRAFGSVGAVLLVAPAALPLAVHFAPIPVPIPYVVAVAGALLAAGAAVLAVRRRGDERAPVAVAAVVALLQCGAAILAPSIARRLTTHPVVEILRARLTAADGFVHYSGYFPNVPFYLGRVPYFMFGNRELDFGVSLEGNGPWLVDTMRQLEERLERRRTFFVLRTRERDLQALARLPGHVEVLHRGRTSSLVEYRP
ncbi:MAG: glycosyltransferase family 39 protein [Deltaproteobacteria bacterium]|nr:glycosyltransferase family 39 protein [Deltaproteobacteria bacterium]